MKSILFVFAIACIVFESRVPVSIAQEVWNGCSSSGCEGGGCHYRNDSRDQIPYRRGSGYLSPGSNYGYPMNSYDQSYGRGFDGNCSFGRYPSRGDGRFAAERSNCPGGSCQFERFPTDDRFGANRNSPYPPGPNPGFVGRADNYSSGEYFVTPPRRSQESYPRSPADQRPQLGAPLFTPPSGYSAGSSRNGFSNRQPEPLATIQTMPPPELPYRPSTGLQRMPQRPSSTGAIVDQRQPPVDNHAGHDHSAHDHAGHNHQH